MQIGLTGGIASDKPTVARRLEQLGAFTIDANVLARDVVTLGTEGLKTVVARFGSSVLAADGGLGRSVLARMIFADPQARADLNAIIRSLVRKRATELGAAAPTGVVVVHVIPLLVETGQQDRFDAIMVMDTTVEEQPRRLTRCDGLTQAEVEQRVAAQANRKERLNAVMHVIDSSGPVREAMRQADELWQNPSTWDAEFPVDLGEVRCGRREDPLGERLR